MSQNSRITISADITLRGNLTRDFEGRDVGNNKHVATSAIAINNRVRDDQGNWSDGETAYVDVSCWDYLARDVEVACRKGDRVVVTGRLEQRSFTTRDGQARTVLEIVADEVAKSVKFASRNSGGARNSAPKSAARDEAPAYDDQDFDFDALADEPF